MQVRVEFEGVQPAMKCDIHQEFIAVVNLLKQPAVLLDRNAEIMTCNPAFDQWVGHSANALSGRSFAIYLGDDHQKQFATFLTQCEAADSTVAHPLACIFACGAKALHLLVSPLVIDGVVQAYLGQTDPAVSDTNLKLKYLVEHLDQGVWEYYPLEDRFLASPKWYQLRGLSPDPEIKLAQRQWTDDIHPDDRAALQSVFGGQTRGEEESINIQYRHWHAAGRWVWIMCNAKIVAFENDGVPSRIVGTDTDITQAKEYEGDMVQLAEKLRLAIDAAGIGVWEFDPNVGTVHWDDKMLEMYGLDDNQNNRSGTLWETYLHPDDRADMIAYSEHCLKQGLDFSHDYRVVRPDGEVRHIRSRASQAAVPGASPKLVGVNIDVTDDYRRAKELERAKAQLQYDSRHDALTGLANRRLLDETTATVLARADHTEGYAVLHLDLDHFKHVNDTLGHAAGDAVLREVAQRLKAIIGDAGLVCRIGGDEFAVLFETAPSRDSIGRTCNLIIRALSAPIMYEGYECKIGVSIGCAYGHGSVDASSEIFLRADNALYKAKAAGRNCYRVHPSS